MTLEQLAMAGEFIGGFAVVIILIFLTCQIRLSNANQQREIYRAFTEERRCGPFNPAAQIAELFL